MDRLLELINKDGSVFTGIPTNYAVEEGMIQDRIYIVTSLVPVRKSKPRLVSTYIRQSDLIHQFRSVRPTNDKDEMTTEMRDRYTEELLKEYNVKNVVKLKKDRFPIYTQAKPWVKVNVS